MDRATIQRLFIESVVKLLLLLLFPHANDSDGCVGCCGGSHYQECEVSIIMLFLLSSLSSEQQSSVRFINCITLMLLLLLQWSFHTRQIISLDSLPNLSSLAIIKKKKTTLSIIPFQITYGHHGLSPVSTEDL